MIFAGVGVLAVLVTAFLTDVGWDGMLMEMLSLIGVLLVGACVAAAVTVNEFAAAGILCFGLVGLGWRAERKLDSEVAEILRRREVLTERGVDTTATVKAVKRTGWTINDQPQLEFTVALTLADGRTKEVTEQRCVDAHQVDTFVAGQRVAVRYVPDEPDNYRVDWGEAPSAKELPTVSGTGAQLDGPLWTFGTQEAASWMLPPRRDGMRLVVLRVADPHHAERDAESEFLVECAALLIAEMLWLKTDVRATGVVFVNVEEKKLVQLCGAAPSYDDFQPFLRSLEDEPAVVWGEALPDLDNQGFNLRVRLPGSTVEQAFSGPLLELADALRDFFMRKGLCSTVEPPNWYRVPADRRRALVVHNLLLQILADEKNSAVPKLGRSFADDIVSCALDLAREQNDDGVVKLIAVLSALYAARAGTLSPQHRQRALELVRDADVNHPLHRLAPLALAELGESLEAQSRRKDLEPKAEPGYAAWLAGVDVE